MSGLRRPVPSALPGCDYYDPANFELERRPDLEGQHG